MSLIDPAVYDVGDPTTLADCPPGMFVHDGVLGFKTEYGAPRLVDIGAGRVEYFATNFAETYCIDSGETFWAGTGTLEERDALIVRPLLRRDERGRP